MPLVELSETKVQDFRRIYEQRYGVALSQTEARDLATRLVELVMLAYSLD